MVIVGFISGSVEPEGWRSDTSFLATGPVSGDCPWASEPEFNVSA